MRVLLLLALLTASSYSYSQGSFQSYYGGTAEEYGYQIIETTDGNFLACGRTFSFGTGGWEGYLVKLTPSGDTLWTQTYGNILYDEIQDVDNTLDGGYILTGHTTINDWAGDLLLIKVDANGNIVWDQTYGGAGGLSDKGYGVIATADGGYAVTGTTESFGSGGDDVYVIKTNSTGVIEWTRTVGTTGSIEAGRDIQQVSGGSYVIAGYSDGSGTSFYDVFLVKLNAAGVPLWSKTYGGSSYDFAYTVEETSDMGYILGATTDSFGAGGWDAYLLKTDVDGNHEWSRAYGLGGEDRVQAAKQTSDGGYILCGRSDSFGAGNYDATLHKTDGSGVLQWSMAYGGGSEDQAWSVKEVSGGYVCCGYSFSYGAGSRELCILRTDANGASGCNETSGALSTTVTSTVVGTLGLNSSGGTATAVPIAMSNTNSIITVECTMSDGCTDELACNYDPTATVDDGSCDYVSCVGCTDPMAYNYDDEATIDSGCCFYLDTAAICGPGTLWSEELQQCVSVCPGDLDFDGSINTLDLLLFLSVFGLPCP